jgi:uncharacterized protein HemY
MFGQKTTYNIKKPMQYFNKKFLLAMYLCLVPYTAIAAFFSMTPTVPPQPTESTLLNQYYSLKKSNPTQAKEVLKKLVTEHPNNVTGELEMGYLLIQEKKNKEAIPYFQIGQKLDPSNTQTKQQLAYLLAAENQSKTTPNQPHTIEEKNPKGTSSQAPADSTLLNQYYSLKKSNPTQAKEILEKLVKQYPHNVTAELEMGYLLIQEKKNKDAIPYFQAAQKLDPSNNQTKRQLAYLLAEDQSKKNQSNAPKAAPTLMDQYYAIKKKNPQEAELILRKILEKTPNDLNANLEMGYLLSSQKRKKEAIYYFQVAEKVDPSKYDVKLEVAYLLNDAGRNRDSYYKFQEVSQAPDCKTRQKGEDGMVGLAGAQTKIFQKPFFIDFYTAPYYLSRFKDYIFPLQARAGITYGKNAQGELYTTIRYNRDTQSNVSNAIPAIYGDNSVDYAIGTDYQPFQKIPISGYIELGRAYELVTNDHGRRWKPDFRLGITGYTAYGAPPVYASCLTFPGKFIGDVYGDFSYYSRYVHDWIGQLRVRPGIRALAYHNSSLDLYMNVNTLFDTERLFYNTILEAGPGIAFTPDNRFNFVVRAQATLGYYLPINTSQPNPYASIYRTTIVEFETYMRF